MSHNRRWEIGIPQDGFTLLHRLPHSMGQWRCKVGHSFQAVITHDKPYCQVCLKEGKYTRPTPKGTPISREPLPDQPTSLVGMYDKYLPAHRDVMTKGAE